MAKTQSQKERHRRWLNKNPEYLLKRLKRWLEVEVNPDKKKLAKYLLEKHLKRNPQLSAKSSTIFCEVVKDAGKSRGVRGLTGEKVADKLAKAGKQAGKN